MLSKEIVQNQREYFKNQHTISYDFRNNALSKLKKAILKYEGELTDALYNDLGKNQAESFFAETGQVLKELTYIQKRLKRLMKNKKVKSSIIDFPSKSFISPYPYGVTLIISPWNYPVMLSLGPLIGAIAAGNTVIIKPSEFSVNTSKVLEKMISSTFEDNYIKVINGAVKETQELLNQKLDYIFFTGSSNVGKIVMEKASKHLTPISLELGGKSPVIVSECANIKVAAKRIVFGKLLNSGQTCIAPNHVYIHESVKKEFIGYLKESIEEFFGDNPIDSKDYGKIINEKHYNRLINLLDGETIIYGGNKNDKLQKISPTILDDVTHNSKVMQEEIFGPILPLITYNELNEVITYINSNPTPLSLYLFTENNDVVKRILNECNFGGGCINDTIVHVASNYLPFGGVGESGIGSYHGKASFDTFTHYRSIIHKSTKLDIKIRYAPYTESKEKIIRKILK